MHVRIFMLKCILLNVMSFTVHKRQNGFKAILVLVQGKGPLELKCTFFLAFSMYMLDLR